eukprot:jgi/Mesen1/7538/ME000391S06772
MASRNVKDEVIDMMALPKPIAEIRTHRVGPDAIIFDSPFHKGNGESPVSLPRERKVKFSSPPKSESHIIIENPMRDSDDEDDTEPEGVDFEALKRAAQEAASIPDKLPRTYSVLIARFALMVLLALGIILMAVLTWYTTTAYMTNSVDKVGKALRTQLLERSRGAFENRLGQLYSAANGFGNTLQSQDLKSADDMARTIAKVRPLNWFAFTVMPTITTVAFFRADGGLLMYWRDYLAPGTYFEYNDASSGSPNGSWFWQPVKPETGDPLGPATRTTGAPTQRTQELVLRVPLNRTVVWLITSDRSFGPWIAAAQAVTDRTSGELLGMSAVQFTMKQLSSNLELWVGQIHLNGAVLYFLDQSGNLIAVSDKSPLTTPAGGLLQAVNSTSLAINMSANYLAGKKLLHSGVHTLSNVNLHGKLYFVDTVAISLHGLNLSRAPDAHGWNHRTGLVDILLSDDDLTSEQLDSLSQVKRCSMALLGLLNNILDLSKIESGMLKVEKVDFNLRNEMESVVDMFSVQCLASGVEIALELEDEVPYIVLGDSARFRQILANLMSNSIKFTKSGSVVVRGWVREPAQEFLKVAYTSEKEEEAVLQKWHQIVLGFEVEDTGLGIHPSKWESVFESFVQADESTTRTHGGTGLGLSIVRAFIEKMGGKIAIAPKDGPGTLICFHLVFELPSPSPVVGRSGPLEQAAIADYLENMMRGLRGSQVLLAMPDGIGKDIIAGWLTRRGLTVFSVTQWGQVVPTLERLIAARDSGERLPPGAVGEPVATSSGASGKRAAAMEAEAAEEEEEEEEDEEDSDTSPSGDGHRPRLFKLRSRERKVGDVFAVLDMAVFPHAPGGGGSSGNHGVQSGEIVDQLQPIREQNAKIGWVLLPNVPTATRQALREAGMTCMANKPIHATKLIHLMLSLAGKVDESAAFSLSNSRKKLDLREQVLIAQGIGAQQMDLHDASDVEPSRWSEKGAVTEPPSPVDASQCNGGAAADAAAAWARGEVDAADVAMGGEGGAHAEVGVGRGKAEQAFSTSSRGGGFNFQASGSGVGSGSVAGSEPGPGLVQTAEVGTSGASGPASASSAFLSLLPPLPTDVRRPLSHGSSGGSSPSWAPPGSATSTSTGEHGETPFPAAGRPPLTGSHSRGHSAGDAPTLALSSSRPPPLPPTATSSITSGSGSGFDKPGAAAATAAAGSAVSSPSSAATGGGSTATKKLDRPLSLRLPPSEPTISSPALLPSSSSSSSLLGEGRQVAPSPPLAVMKRSASSDCLLSTAATKRSPSSSVNGSPSRTAGPLAGLRQQGGFATHQKTALAGISILLAEDTPVLRNSPLPRSLFPLPRSLFPLPLSPPAPSPPPAAAATCLLRHVLLLSSHSICCSLLFSIALPFLLFHFALAGRP